MNKFFVNSNMENQNTFIQGKTYLTDMEIGITKVSSKGQIVIPSELRYDLKEGEQLLIIKNKNQLILKKADELDKSLIEDLEFAKRTEKAYKNFEKGKFKSLKAKDFLEELGKW